MEKCATAGLSSSAVSKVSTAGQASSGTRHCSDLGVDLFRPTSEPFAHSRGQELGHGACALLGLGLADRRRGRART